METGAEFWIAVAIAAGSTGIAVSLWRRLTRLDAARRDTDDQIERMRSFIAVSADWTWEQDARFRFTHVSDSATSVLGGRPEDYLGRTRREIAPDALDNLAFAAHEQLQARHAPIRNLRLRHRIPTGEIRYVEIDGDPVHGEDGTFLGYRGVGRDVTFLVEAEREASETQRRFLSAIEARSEGISFWDREDRLRLFNTAFQTLSPGGESLLREGVRFEDFVRASVNSGVVPDAVGREEEWVAERLETRRRAPSTFELQRGDLWLRISELRTPDGWVLHAALDITEAKQREEALRRAVAEAEIANRAKMEFLAVMSHELRTPLNAIIGFSDVIQNRILGDAMDTYMRYAEHINESGTHLLALINDLLDVSRIEAGRLELEEMTFSLHDLIGECARMLRVRADDKTVDLTVDRGVDGDVDGADPDRGIHADRRALKQVIVNLVSNAIKFTPSGGEVRVRTGTDGDGRIFLVVADTGIGIPPDRHEIVFRPFEQLENAHARKHDGTGLGLYITRNLVEAHGGTIHLDSEIDEGTTITITFPAHRTVALEPGRFNSNRSEPIVL